MAINTINNSLNCSFKSRNIPIPNIKIFTKNGTVIFRELNYDRVSDEFHRAIARFQLENLANSSANPNFRLVDKTSNEFDLETFISYSKYFIRTVTRAHKKDLKNPNATLLYGTTKNGKIIGTIEITPLKKRDIDEPKTLKLTSFYLSTPYRKCGIGSKLMSLITEAAKGTFSRITLCANNNAIGFYEKQGYSIINPTTPRAKILQQSNLNPKYSTWMEKEI